MNIFRSSRIHYSDTSGFSLVEVLVAMMVFAVVALGVAFGIVTSLVFTKETRSREVATNLASQEIDLDRSFNDIFAVVDAPPWDQVVNGTTFHVARTTSWVSEDDSTKVCGSGGGTLQYKRINISVTWDGQSAATPAVQADTLIAPNSRINDPALGTIIVSVKSASGAGTQGVSVTVTPNAIVPNTAVALASPTLPVTDAQGCTFALRVSPGKYDVKITKTNYVDINQNSTVTKLADVVAGGAAAPPFDFDNSARFDLDFASNYTSGNPVQPTNLDTTFISTVGGVYVTQLGVATSAYLFPFSGGYAALAGAYVAPVGSAPSCLNVDSAMWTTPAADGAVGQALPTSAAAPGGNVPTNIPMGVLTVNGLTANNFVTAVGQSAPLGSGDPGCGIHAIYKFPKLTSSTTTIDLPFGSWTLYTGTTAGSTTTVIPATAARMVLLTRGILTPLSSIVTLDPRLVVP
ncbi:prepilin-type N-terminal cleavage/methylation domain-containing protein [Cryobacterium sp. RTC2.1]|uniref:type IV pilus modification PilV family protein n=1 Tax=Cryobacterium sp. RTC2.1 TaxID=3048634 RepID=UPI002B2385D7|nr:prepilin-type N-terminal cleavage/methylation domain-containing protein [Cryobacterium sp. RTC2.1]MEB0002152.1 prepilin-type N-terminal cleavage/methylation domain-containing protein [Cryobacterium sp. RTC2.1]